MFNALIGSVFVGLILLGTVAICYIIMLKLLLPKSERDFYVFIPCDKHTVGVRKKAYGMRMKLNLIGDEFCSKVIVIDDGISEQERTQLLEICKETNGIYIIQKDNIREFFDDRI